MSLWSGAVAHVDASAGRCSLVQVGHNFAVEEQDPVRHVFGETGFAQPGGAGAFSDRRHPVLVGAICFRAHGS